MLYPKIKSVSAMDDYSLLIEFDNKQRKTYDVSLLFNQERFAPLKNKALFKSFMIEPGGYAVSWNAEIDISEYELWRHGQPILENFFS